MMSGSEGEIVRTPFDGIPMNRWPHDFYSVAFCRMNIQAIEREVRMNDEFPEPSARTKKSRTGMDLWRDFVKWERKRSFERKENDPRPMWEAAMVPGFYPVYDYTATNESGILWGHAVHGYLRTYKEAMAEVKAEQRAARQKSAPPPGRH